MKKPTKKQFIAMTTAEQDAVLNTIMEEQERLGQQIVEILNKNTTKGDNLGGNELHSEEFK